MKHSGVLIALLILSYQPMQAQTCCSGGVPISSNIGFNSDDAQTLQLSFTTDFNVLKSLYSGSEKLDDGLRKRTTQSYLIRGAYTFSSRLSIETSVSLVRQTRKIYGRNENIDFQSTFGIGDPVILIIYDVIKGPFNWRVGLGPQVPLGRTNLLSDRGLFLVEDLQPGSGAWDAIMFSSLSITSFLRPTNTLFLNAIYSSTGANNDSRGGRQTYEFGNDLQLISGISDQFVWFGQILSPSIGLRFRAANRDAIDGIANSGTGGTFLFLRGGLSLDVSNDYRLSLNGELPIYTRVNETQLATSYTINLSLYKRFSFRKDTNDSFPNLIEMP